MYDIIEVTINGKKVNPNDIVVKWREWDGEEHSGSIESCAWNVPYKSKQTYNEWIIFEEGCELPDEWEGVIVAAPQHKSKIMHCVYINGEFHTLGIRDQVIIPKKFMRINTSNITMKDAYTYRKKVSKG